jgi:hypothetical protein
MIGPEYVWVGTDAWIFQDFWNSKDNRTAEIKKAGMNAKK